MPKLYELAHCRAGDKGNTSTLSVIAYLLLVQVFSPNPRSRQHNSQELAGERIDDTVAVLVRAPEAVWGETELHGLFDSELFSCDVGLRKPDPRIYLLACEQLGVEPAEALFVGDGANDELAGADRVGMRAVLIHRPAEEPQWDGLRDWPGPRITSIPEILEVVGPAS